jgi:hypothetical protein
MLLEAIILLSLLMVALSVGMFLLKFVFAVVLIPIKVAFFLTKGLLGLLIVVPLLLIFGSIFLALLPVGAALLVLLVLPLVLLGGAAVKFASC